MTGTFAGALAARGIEVEPGALEGHAEGDIEKVERTIRVTEIRVTYKLPIPSEHREAAERALELHPASCPAHESVKDSIRVKIGAEIDWQ
ncbi:MAG: OsmC family protein [SAR324 cluster bacterium]|nr:OsmC family protein [SAR324 cluster bacterium]MCZ6748774.1 OsmC family protein [SAR324 cluster bacterium]